MTDKIPADKVRAILDEWERIKEHADWEDMDNLVQDVRALLPAPPRPTLADMTPEDRSACRWAQADVGQIGLRHVITVPDRGDGHAALLNPWGGVSYKAHDTITPRPDLPRMEWPDADQGGEEVTKVDYVSVAGGRTAYGPWTVARLRKKADPDPALPGDWRLADHPEHGRVIVTTTTPDDDGDFYFMFPADDLTGYDWDACRPAELTYIDTEPEVIK